jgi:hypothetical protein
MLDRTLFELNIAAAIARGYAKRGYLISVDEAQTRARQVADALPQLFRRSGEMGTPRTATPPTSRFDSDLRLQLKERP